MSASAPRPMAGPPQLRLVRSSLRPMDAPDAHDQWRRVAAAIVASTWDVSRHLRDLRWGRVHEELSERRELLGMMRAMQLDADGRSCLRSLDAAALESERVITAIMGKNG